MMTAKTKAFTSEDLSEFEIIINESVKSIQSEVNEHANILTALKTNKLIESSIESISIMRDKQQSAFSDVEKVVNRLISLIKQPEKKEIKRRRATFVIATEVYNELPLELKEGLKDINILDKTCENTSFWSDKYSIQDLQVVATSNNGNICFFQDNVMYDDNYIEHIIINAASHALDQRLGLYIGSTGNWQQEGWYSQQANGAWHSAISADIKAKNVQSPTNYGLNSPKEDFSESISLFLRDEASFRKDYPNRALALESAFLTLRVMK